MGNPYYAHTPNENGVWHGLEDHLRGTARLAGEFAKPFAMKEWAERIALHHDVGKFSARFQDYLHACERAGKAGHAAPASHVDHSSAGALLAQLTSASVQAVPHCVAGHHAGLQDPVSLHERLQSKIQQPDVVAAVKTAIETMPELCTPVAAASVLDDQLSIRMLFSALIDADRLDTEGHFTKAQADGRGHWLPLDEVAQHFDKAYTSAFAAVRDSPVNSIRAEVYKSCGAAATLEPGFFRLTVPTGGGKTLSSLSFCLRHALAHGLRRVVYALPFTTITEQTADVFRRFLGPDAVLEHHSQLADNLSDDMSPKAVRNRLGTENWDAPVIVTTTVQLLESLFSNRPSKCRKLHRLAGSVIVLDEVQALPARLLSPIMKMLESLVESFRVSIVLCSATQPALATSGLLKSAAREIVPQYPRHFAALRRVDYQWMKEPLSWSEIAGAISDERQVLTVLNTRADAQKLLDALGDAPGVYHLSTLLCGAHRRQVLREVRERLANGEVCRLVSTQLIEAGVDVDFPTVLRAAAPLDSLVQAAGRCNREGKGSSRGRVLVFSPKDGGLPQGSYRSGTAESLHILADGYDLHEPGTIELYYQRWFDTIEMDAQGLIPLLSKCDFSQMAERFHMIEATATVIVPYDDVARGLIQRIKFGGLTRSLLRAVQPYTISIRTREFNKGPVEEIQDGIGIWLGTYDVLRGASSIGIDPGYLMA